jgi:DivIVA domain-containing protein
LTPEEVISKTFQPTRFAEGYNQDEVDDFLDEVVSTLRALQQENDELRGKLSSCESRVAELSAGAAVVTESKPAGTVEIGRVPEIGTTPEPAPVAFIGDGGDGASSAAGMLALAQRLHDEHVRNGQQQRDALIADAQSKAERMVSDAEQTRVSTLSTLQLERDQLEATITSLRGFEHEYRSRLRSFLQAQISDLETQPALEPETSDA